MRETDRTEQNAPAASVDKNLDCGDGTNDYRLVYVLWRDAHADGGGSWLSVSDIEDAPYIVRSSGFLLESAKKDHVSIAQSLGDDEGVVDHVLHIPSAMVIMIHYPLVPDLYNAYKKREDQ